MHRHGQLLVVLAWQAVHMPSYSPVAAQADRGQREAAAQAVLAQALRSALGPNAQDDVMTKVIEGPAERVLVEESSSADLLVLGSALAPAHSGSGIGPVIRACLNQARCPVMVIGHRGRAPAPPPERVPERPLEGSGAHAR
jgi:nucleotide-binding universal stress UspA family protein